MALAFEKFAESLGADVRHVNVPTFVTAQWRGPRHA